MASDNLEVRRTASNKEFYLPKKELGEERYIRMTEEDRNKVYQSTKEALAGDLSKASRESLAKKAWEDLAGPSLNYTLKKKATELKGMPISQAILDACTQAKKSNLNALGKRTPRQVMFYCLDYLQNKEKMPNIDLVKKDEYVEIYKEESTQRWKLRVLNDKGEVQRGMDGYLFPPAAAPVAPAPAPVAAPEPAPAVVSEPAPAAVPEPAPAAVPEPAPAVVSEPAPAVVSEPAPAVVPEPAPAVVPEPAPAVVPEPAPAVVPEPAPAVVPEPAPTSAPEPAPTTPTPTEPAPAPSPVEPPEHIEHTIGGGISERAVVEIQKVVADKAASLAYLDRVYKSIPDDLRPSCNVNYDPANLAVENSADAKTRYDSLVQFLVFLYDSRIPYQEVAGEEPSVPANADSNHMVPPPYSPAPEPAPAPVPEPPPAPVPEPPPAPEVLTEESNFLPETFPPDWLDKISYYLPGDYNDIIKNWAQIRKSSIDQPFKSDIATYAAQGEQVFKNLTPSTFNYWWEIRELDTDTRYVLFENRFQKVHGVGSYDIGDSPSLFQIDGNESELFNRRGYPMKEERGLWFIEHPQEPSIKRYYRKEGGNIIECFPSGIPLKPLSVPAQTPAPTSTPEPAPAVVPEPAPAAREDLTAPQVEIKNVQDLSTGKEVELQDGRRILIPKDIGIGTSYRLAKAAVEGVGTNWRLPTKEDAQLIKMLAEQRPDLFQQYNYWAGELVNDVDVGQRVFGGTLVWTIDSQTGEGSYMVPDGMAAVIFIQDAPAGAPAEAVEGSLDHPLMDSAMTREQALLGLTDRSPEHLKQKTAIDGKMEKQELVDVKYYSFDGKVHQGQILVDQRLAEDVRAIFEVILKEKFPIQSVEPLAWPRFNWTDSASMTANNSSGFNYRSAGQDALVAGQPLSRHAAGFAIDLNPVQNPFILSSGKTLPEGATHDLAKAGTLTSGHPVVQAFESRGWQWGGTWRSPDYQHFQKVLSE